MNKEERSVVLPVTFGSMFEWYEVFLYFYWMPVLSAKFVDLSLPLAELIYAALILSTGLIARPIGGIIFGYIGDRWGRRVSFLISIVLITIPSLGVAIMPTFSSWAYFSLVYVGLMRFLQGIPAGGELPGALCLLAEGANPSRKRYLCSYLFVGPQIGQILSMLQCLLLEKYLSNEQLVTWGWRLSFLIGGAIGILGFFLRKRLRESAEFKTLRVNDKIEHRPLRESFRNHKKNMAVGFFISLFEVVGFFMIYFYLLQNTSILSVKPSDTLVLNSIFLAFVTIMMPIFGKFGSKYEIKSLLKLSAICVIIVSIPFYLAVNYDSKFYVFLLLFVILLIYCIQFSHLPSLIVDLFPTRVRYTCIGFSFNIADGVIGGIIPYMGTLLILATGRSAGFVLLFPITAIIFLISLRFVKERSSMAH